MLKPIELYYWPTPNGWKISIALEEMGLDYNLNLIDIGSGDQFKPEFMKVSPNSKMPAIIDPDGPDGKPISIFESGAILQYLANKTGKFYGNSQRDRILIDQWLMWQMGGLGPMAGQAHHFLQYAPSMDPPHNLPYAKERYKNEVTRLYDVLDKQLDGQDYICEEYSIADMASYGWASLWENQGQDIAKFPNVEQWLKRCANRDAVRKGRALSNENRTNLKTDKEAQKQLFKRKV